MIQHYDDSSIKLDMVVLPLRFTWTRWFKEIIHCWFIVILAGVNRRH